MDFNQPKYSFGPVGRVAGLALVGTLLITSFQNCGKAGFDSETSESVLSSQTAAASEDLIQKYGTSRAAKVQAMPFAFDIDVDQLTYNGCYDDSYAAKPGAFSFKIGSYRSDRGLKIRTEVAEYINTNFSSNAVTLSDRKSYVYDSPKNQGLVLQFAWRNFAQPYWPRNATNAKPGVDYTDYGLEVTDDRVLDPVMRSTAGANYFGLAPEPKQRNLEYSMFFNQTETSADLLRKDVGMDGGGLTDGQKGILAFTFKKPGEEGFVPLAPIENNTQVAYGVGFQVEFTKFGATSYYNNPNNVLYSVKQVSLETTKKPVVGTPWTCSENMRFVIVRAQDAALACPPPTFAQATNATYKEQLKILRRHLPASDWDINVAARCVVPKGFKCYDETKVGGIIPPVEYNPAKECYEGVVNEGGALAKQYNDPSKIPVNVCAQYISVCLK